MAERIEKIEMTQMETWGEHHSPRIHDVPISAPLFGFATRTLLCHASLLEMR